MLVLFTVQIGRRLGECFLVHKFSEGAVMSVVHLFVGLSYYVVTPMAVVAASPLAASLVAPWVDLSAATAVPCSPSRLIWDGLGALPIGGVVLAVSGMALQAHSHWILAGLRGGSGSKASGRRRRTTERYVMPSAGAFRWVACPHFLGEMAFYAGLWWCSGFRSRAVGGALVWTVVNLGFTARTTLAWYRDKFDDYPPSRTAVIPFLF